MVIVKEAMIRGVRTIQKDNTVFEAAAEMAERNISCLVVVEDANVIGIITGKDIVKKVVAQKLDPETTKVEQVMASPAKTINENEELKTAAELMTFSKIKQLPVLNSFGLAGIITQTDVSKFG